MDEISGHPVPSFNERTPTVKFDEPTQGWGYLPQVNEKFRLELTWECVRVGGEAHIPTFKAIPGTRDLQLKTPPTLILI
jgi:hypothetical protein